MRIKSHIFMPLLVNTNMLRFAVLASLITVTPVFSQTQAGTPQEPGSVPAASSTNQGSPAPPVVKKAPEDYDPLLDPPPLPHATVTLIGGMITELDEIQNRVTVKPFAGKQRLHLDFDVRTHVFLDGRPAALRDLQSGQRVYLDTMLDGSKVFAKSIWIRSTPESGNGRGQILRYDSRANTLTVRDEVSAQPVSFRLDSATVIHNGNTSGSVEDLKTGALVAVTFDPKQGRTGVVRDVSLLAEPGSTFTFLGKITFIDLSQKMIAIGNQSDDKDYDIYFDSIPEGVLKELREGSEASISAVFDGTRYVAQKVDMVPTQQNMESK
jgi:hypothetical protein